MNQRSHTARLLSAGRRRLLAAFETAATVRRLCAGTDRAVTVLAHSRLAAVGRRGERAARASRLYTWFTAEPDPDVVVVDLRETYAVGPVLSLLDRVLRVLANGRDQARSGTLFDDLRGSLAARPIQVLGIVALTAVGVDLVSTAVFGSLTATAVGFRLLAASLALAGTRVKASWEDVTESRVHDRLATLLAPPEPPDER